jgi:hypothetical protein
MGPLDTSELSVVAFGTIEPFCGINHNHEIIAVREAASGRAFCVGD